MNGPETTSRCRFAVRCIKADGVRRVEFKRYAERGPAEIDLAGLRRVGIRAELVELAVSDGQDRVQSEERA